MFDRCFIFYFLIPKLHIPTLLFLMDIINMSNTTTVTNITSLATTISTTSSEKLIYPAQDVGKLMAEVVPLEEAIEDDKDLYHYKDTNGLEETFSSED